jgi:hypothetical protein
VRRRQQIVDVSELLHLALGDGERLIPCWVDSHLGTMPVIGASGARSSCPSMARNVLAPIGVGQLAGSLRQLRFEPVADRRRG